jgi:hypothetical protein
VGREKEMSSTTREALGWTSIRRVGAPHVRRLSAPAHDRLRVRLTLSARPPAAWATAFDALANAGRGMEVHQDEIHLDVPERAFRDSVIEADDRIAAANRLYENAVLPASRGAGERLPVESEDGERRPADARRRASSSALISSSERPDGTFIWKSRLQI